MPVNVRNVLLGITHEIGEEESFSALPYALSLAHEAGAHLTLQAASVKVILANAFVADFAAEPVAAENRRLSALAAAAAERARGEAQAAGVICTAEARELAYAELVDAFAAQARVHDLTILDAEPVAVALGRGVIEAVLLGSGRPVVAVPPGTERFRARRVVAAWDGSARAARSVNGALPFLTAAEAVDVVSVEKGGTAADLRGADIARHLARHGIAVSVTTLPEEGGGVAETLRRHATLLQADLLVTGAYGHSRLREVLLGGATRSLLRSGPAPLFLSH